METSLSLGAPSLDHLSPKHKKIAFLGDDKRIRFIQKDIWISYPQSDVVRAAVHAILNMPKKSQAQCILVSANAGMGKSCLFNRILSDVRKSVPNGRARSGVLSFTLEETLSVHSLVDVIYTALGVNSPPGSLREKKKNLTVLLKARGIKAILIDEFHHLLLTGRLEQRKILAFMKNLGGSPSFISMIAFGVEDAENALRSDRQLERRFQIYHLMPWTESEELRSFLIAYEQQLPIRLPSELWKREKVTYLLNASAGITDEIVTRISRGAIWSILMRKECIDIECLEKAAMIPPLPEDYTSE
jgi:hypothetical protein